MASDSNTDVDIDGETFSLVSIPNARSKLVQNAKESLHDTLDLERLLEDMNKLGKCYRVVYNGVAGYTEMQIEIQRVGYKITDLMDNLAFTVLMFKKESRTVLLKLQITYQFLLDGQENMALKTLSLLADLADKMATDSKELQVAFDAIIVDVRDALQKCMKERGNQESTGDQHEKIRKEYKIGEKKAEAQQTSAKDEEKKAKNRYDEAQKRQDKEGGLMTKVLSLISGGTGGFVAGNYAVGGLLVAGIGVPICGAVALGSTAMLANEIWNSLGQSEATKMRHQEKMKHLEEMYKHQNDHRDALLQLIELTEKIKNCEDDSKLAEAAIDALHHSITALKNISVTMMKAVQFWKRMYTSCKSLAERDVLQLIEEAMKDSVEKRRDAWTSPGFKINAIHHYSQWVAFEDVCGVCTSNIKDISRDMYAYLLENPTREQARNNVRELAISFGSDLKITLKKIDDKNIKAPGEEKKLKDVSK